MKIVHTSEDDAINAVKAKHPRLGPGVWFAQTVSDPDNPVGFYWYVQRKNKGGHYREWVVDQVTGEIKEI